MCIQDKYGIKAIPETSDNQIAEVNTTIERAHKVVGSQ
jgi:hypothetical protein